MGQVGMTEARGGRVEFPDEGLARRKPVQSEWGQEIREGLGGCHEKEAVCKNTYINARLLLQPGKQPFPIHPR